MTEQIAETELSYAEVEYARLSAELTRLNVDIDAAEDDFNRYQFQHPPMTLLGGAAVVHGADARLEQLANRLNELQQQRQSLLPLWSELKSSINGW